MTLVAITLGPLTIFNRGLTQAAIVLESLSVRAAVSCFSPPYLIQGPRKTALPSLHRNTGDPTKPSKPLYRRVAHHGLKQIHIKTSWRVALQGPPSVCLIGNALSKKRNRSTGSLVLYLQLKTLPPPYHNTWVLSTMLKSTQRIGFDMNVLGRKLVARKLDEKGGVATTAGWGFGQHFAGGKPSEWEYTA